MRRWRESTTDTMAGGRSGRFSTAMRLPAKGMPKPPYVDTAADFFFSANRLADLAKKIVMKYQRLPMPPANLEKTVARYNSFVDSGVNEDFGKPTSMYKISKPPFYAAWATPAHPRRAAHQCQMPSPRHARRDHSGALLRWGIGRRFQSHGLARAACQGYIAGNAAAGAG